HPRRVSRAGAAGPAAGACRRYDPTGPAGARAVAGAAGGFAARRGMSVPAFLPWQINAARAWLGERDRFAHAWLVHGLAGIGKLEFAAAAAASLLCEAPRQGLACGA